MTTAADPRGLHLHVDCASGAAGDMMLGALLDLGVPRAAVDAALVALGLDPGRLRAVKVVKRGIAATDVKVDTSGTLHGASTEHEQGGHGGPPHQSTPGGHGGPPHHSTQGGHGGPHPGHGHGHEHEHEHAHSHARVHGHDDEHAHRHDDDTQDHVPVHAHDHADHAHHHYGDIRRRIEAAGLTPGTKRRALDIFDRIARAEAKLHGTTVELVAFHEVGAIDSIIDVVGTAAALDWLSPVAMTCVSVAMGHGTVRCAHGTLPVPSPAALEILREAAGVTADGGVARELCTPTGAAILAATVTQWTPAPTGRAGFVGWGAGDAELADRPNVLRVVALAPLATAVTDAVWQIDANLDDMSPELCAPASDAVFAAGALDVWFTPIVMKKGRPALALSALATEASRAAVVTAILRETTTIGVRFSLRERTVLARRTVVVETRYGRISVKLAIGDDQVVQNAAPEYEDCLAVASAHGVPLKLVFAAALAAFDLQR